MAITNDEKAQLESLEQFGLSTKAARQAIETRDNVEARYTETRKALSALRPGDGVDFDKQNTRLSTQLAGLDLALQGAREDCTQEINSLMEQAITADLVVDLSRKIKQVDVKIIDVLLSIPELIRQRFVLFAEITQLRALQQQYASNLHIGFSAPPYHNLPGGGPQTTAGGATLMHYCSRFAQLISIPEPHPGLADSDTRKLEWFSTRLK
jgi:hypothetical protein